MKNKFQEKYFITSKRLKYNKAQSRTKRNTAIALISVLSIAAGVQTSSIIANRVDADTNTTFQVNVVSSLSVSITTPTDWASGGIGTFLRNAVGIDVATNNNKGFTASMYSQDTTDLINSTSGNSETLPTLSSSTTRGNFPANHWGYSLGEYKLDGATQSSYTLNGNSYGETAVGSDTSSYYPLVNTSASPITIMDGSSTAKKTGSQNIYFGSKADVTQASGTYAGTVVISVVTGEIDGTTNPITPENPATDNTNSANNPSYRQTYGPSANQGWTTYTATTTDQGSNTTTTTTEVSEGDTRSSYQRPAGVIENTISNISDNAPLATGLAVTASVAAASGYMFFIVANRREREDEEEA